MKLNTTSDIPLFEQLKNDLLEQIKKGIYISGQQIPTETELSELYHVSRITIRRAITELCNEGVLIKKQGKGTFVKEWKIFRKLEHTLSFSDACKANQMEASTIVTKREVMNSIILIMLNSLRAILLFISNVFDMQMQHLL